MKPWTKAEELYIVDNLHLSNEELAEILSKTVDAVKSKKKRLRAKQFGIQPPYSNNRLTLIDVPFKKKCGRENKTFGLFLCRCGNMKEIRVSSVIDGSCKSCGYCIFKHEGINLII
jgi:hypothetical protein